MRNILTYALFENERPVVSFDFDGCVHVSVDDHYNPSEEHPKDLKPFNLIIEKMQEEAKTNRIVIVTARDGSKENKVCLWEFVNMHDLPVDDIFFTWDGPKVDTLVELKVIRHYDDNPKMKDQLKGTAIEFVQVNPKAGTFGVEKKEALQEGAYDYIGRGSVLLVRGNKGDNGLYRLYATFLAAPPLQLDRVKADGDPGRPVGMVLLEGEYFRIKKDPVLRAVKASPDDKGIKGAVARKNDKDSVGLNDKTGKTPYWRDTTKYTSVQQMLLKMAEAVERIPNIEW